MRGRQYLMVGGPLDGQVRVFHEGSAFVCSVNLQTTPGGAPIIGHARYEFGEVPRADGLYIAHYLRTEVEFDPKEHPFPKKRVVP